MNATLETDYNKSDMTLFIVMVTCLGGSIPLIYCCCCFILFCNRYLYMYGNFANNNINNINNNQGFNFKYLYETCFGTVAPPRLTNVIIVSLVNIKNSPIEPL